MERLKSGEVRAVLRLLEEAYTIVDVGAFAQYLVGALQHVVPAESVSYNEIDPSTRRIAWVRMPPATFPEAEQVFGRFMMEHPTIAYRQRTKIGEALKISDFLTAREFHRTALYNEYYRRVNVEHQLAVALPTSSPQYVAVALNRRSADFNAHERFLLNLLRPHLVQIHSNAEVATRLQSQFKLVSQGVEQIGYGIVVLAKDERIETATISARRWLAEYFEKAEQSDRLPKALEQWVRSYQSVPAEGLPRPPQAFVVERESKRLVVRVLANGTKRILVLSQKLMTIEPRSLESLGLSRREAEVLGWIAEGKTSAVIGKILGVSTRTVQHHLDRIYRKLGVESRTAAAARAFRSVQDLREST